MMVKKRFPPRSPMPNPHLMRLLMVLMVLFSLVYLAGLSRIPIKSGIARSVSTIA